VQDLIGPGSAQADHQVGRVVIRSQGGMDVPWPQGQHDELVVVGTGDHEGQVLVLVVEAVPERQLLVSVGRIVYGIEVERQVTRRTLEGGDELVEEHVAQPLEGRDRDGVLEAGQRGLAGQVVLVRGAVGNQLEDRVVA
jgi:hypothetical protein